MISDDDDRVAAAIDRLESRVTGELEKIRRDVEYLQQVLKTLEVGSGITIVLLAMIAFLVWH